MGWTYCSAWRKKSELLAEQLRESRWPAGTKLIASKSTKSGYSAVWEFADRKRFIEVTLVQNGGKDHGYGYKDMESSMRPYVDDVPVEFFELVPPRDAEEAQWREDMKARQAAKKAAREKGKALAAQLMHGSVVKLTEKYGGVKAEILGSDGKKVTGTINGKVYRIPVTAIETIEVR